MVNRPFNLKQYFAHLEELPTGDGGYCYEIHMVTSKGTLILRDTITDFEQADKTARAINKKGIIDLNRWHLSVEKIT